MLGAVAGLVAGKAAAGGVFVEDGVRVYPEFRQKFDSNPYDVLWIDEQLPADTEWTKKIVLDPGLAPPSIVFLSDWPKSYGPRLFGPA